jgi:AhpD family alkylhydroperoxidase
MTTYLASLPVADFAKREYAAMARLSQTSDEQSQAAGVPQRVLELIRLRASQLNGCSYCVHMHAHDARGIGESEQRLDAVHAWQESDLFDEQERAAFALTEAMTLQGAAAGIDPDAITAAQAAFGDEAASHLAVAITVINAWNRVGVIGAMQPEAAWGDAPAGS